MSRDTATLSQDTTDLIEKAARKSDALSSSDSLDRKLSRITREWLIANQYGGDELAAEVEEHTDTKAEAERKRAQLHEKRRENRVSGSSTSHEERVAELRESESESEPSTKAVREKQAEIRAEMRENV